MGNKPKTGSTIKEKKYVFNEIILESFIIEQKYETNFEGR